MTGPVSYRLDESVAFITMDDGKVNVIGPSMQQALNEALDHADRDDVGAVVIAGNQRVFSGGFDLKVLTSGEVQPAIDMLKGGFELSYRLLSYPKPVVMACTGHAIAMGAFLLASGDHRVAAPAYNVQANEVAIGMTIPYAALEVMKLRLTRSAYQQAAGLAFANPDGQILVELGKAPGLQHVGEHVGGDLRIPLLQPPHAVRREIGGDKGNQQRHHAGRIEERAEQAERRESRRVHHDDFRVGRELVEGMRHRNHQRDR